MLGASVWRSSFGTHLSDSFRSQKASELDEISCQLKQTVELTIDWLAVIKCCTPQNIAHLTHWGWVMHICISKLTIVDSCNGLLPSRCQAIIWTNVGILLIAPLETSFSGILIEIHTFSFKEMHLKMTSAKWRPFCICITQRCTLQNSTHLMMCLHHYVASRV